MFTPSEDLDLTLIYERGDSDATGPASQNRYRFVGFDFAIYEPGDTGLEWNHAILEANRRVSFGGGKLTNVLGWREVELREDLSLTLGARYTYEEKDVKVAASRSDRPVCAADSFACAFDFEDRDSWSNFTPKLGLRLGYAYRDDSEITDDNRRTLDGGHLLDAGVSFSPSGSGLRFELCGRNLLDEVLRRSDFDLFGLAGSTYSPLKEGRVLGFELRGDY